MEQVIINNNKTIIHILNEEEEEEIMYTSSVHVMSETERVFSFLLHTLGLA